MLVCHIIVYHIYYDITVYIYIYSVCILYAYNTILLSSSLCNCRIQGGQARPPHFHPSGLSRVQGPHAENLLSLPCRLLESSFEVEMFAKI